MFLPRDDDRSHAPRGNASSDAPRHPARLETGVVSRTRSVRVHIPTQSVGTIKAVLLVQDLRNSFVKSFTNKSKKMPRSHDRGIFL